MTLLVRSALLLVFLFAGCSPPGNAPSEPSSKVTLVVNTPPSQGHAPSIEHPQTRNGTIDAIDVAIRELLALDTPPSPNSEQSPTAPTSNLAKGKK